MTAVARFRAPHKVHILSWALALEKEGTVSCHFMDCQFMALSIEEMGNHYPYCSCENSKYTFVCESCNRRTDTEEKLLLHKLYSHSYKPTVEEARKIQQYQRLPIKKEVTPIMRRLWEVFLEKKKYLKCLLRQCLYVTNTIEDMEHHYLNMCKENCWSLLSYSCEFCYGRLFNEYDLQLHIRTAHESKTYLTTHNVTPDTTLNCVEMWCNQIQQCKQGKCLIDGCRFVDNNVKILEKHYANCNGRQKHFVTCNLCGCWLQNSSRLREHKRCIHKDQDEDILSYQEPENHRTLLFADDMSPDENDLCEENEIDTNTSRPSDLKKYEVVNKVTRRPSNASNNISVSPVFPAKNTDSIDCKQVKDRSGIQFNNDIIETNESSLDIINIDASSHTKNVLNDGMSMNSVQNKPKIQRRRRSAVATNVKTSLTVANKTPCAVIDKINETNLTTPLQAFANEMMKETKNSTTVPVQIKVDNVDCWTVNISQNQLNLKSSDEFPKNRDALFKSLKEDSYKLLKAVSKKNSIRNDVKMVFDPVENRITPFHINFKIDGNSTDQAINEDNDNLDMTKFLSSDVENADVDGSLSDTSINDENRHQAFESVNVPNQTYSSKKLGIPNKDISCGSRDLARDVSQMAESIEEESESCFQNSSELIHVECENEIKTELIQNVQYEDPLSNTAVSNGDFNIFIKEEVNQNNDTNEGTADFYISQIDQNNVEVTVMKKEVDQNMYAVDKRIEHPMETTIVQADVHRAEEDDERDMSDTEENSVSDLRYDTEYIIPEIDFVDNTSNFKPSTEDNNLSENYKVEGCSNSLQDFGSDADETGVALSEDEISQENRLEYITNIKSNEEVVIINSDLTTPFHSSDQNITAEKDPLCIDGFTGGALFYDLETDYDNVDRAHKNELVSHQTDFSNDNNDCLNSCENGVDVANVNTDEIVDDFNLSNRWNWSTLKKYNYKSSKRDPLLKVRSSQRIMEKVNKKQTEEEQFFGFPDCIESSTKYCEFVNTCSKLGYYDDMIIFNQHYKISQPNRLECNLVELTSSWSVTKEKKEIVDNACNNSTSIKNIDSNSPKKKWSRRKNNNSRKTSSPKLNDDQEEIFYGFESNEQYTQLRRNSIEISRRLSTEFSESKNVIEDSSYSSTCYNGSFSLLEKNMKNNKQQEKPKRPTRRCSTRSRSSANDDSESDAERFSSTNKNVLLEDDSFVHNRSNNNENMLNVTPPTVRRKRGRPRKNSVSFVTSTPTTTVINGMSSLNSSRIDIEICNQNMLCNQSDENKSEIISSNNDTRCTEEQSSTVKNHHSYTKQFFSTAPVPKRRGRPRKIILNTDKLPLPTDIQNLSEVSSDMKNELNQEIIDNEINDVIIETIPNKNLIAERNKIILEVNQNMNWNDASLEMSETKVKVRIPEKLTLEVENETAQCQSNKIEAPNIPNNGSDLNKHTLLLIDDEESMKVEHKKSLDSDHPSNHLRLLGQSNLQSTFSDEIVRNIARNSVYDDANQSNDNLETESSQNEENFNQYLFENTDEESKSEIDVGISEIIGNPTQNISNNNAVLFNGGLIPEDSRNLLNVSSYESKENQQSYMNDMEDNNAIKSHDIEKSKADSFNEHTSGKDENQADSQCTNEETVDPKLALENVHKLNDRSADFKMETYHQIHMDINTESANFDNINDVKQVESETVHYLQHAFSKQKGRHKKIPCSDKLVVNSTTNNKLEVRNKISDMNDDSLLKPMDLEDIEYSPIREARGLSKRLSQGKQTELDQNEKIIDQNITNKKDVQSTKGVRFLDSVCDEGFLPHYNETADTKKLSIEISNDNKISVTPRHVGVKRKRGRQPKCKDKNNSNNDESVNITHHVDSASNQITHLNHSKVICENQSKVTKSQKDIVKTEDRCENEGKEEMILDPEITEYVKSKSVPNSAFEHSSPGNTNSIAADVKDMLFLEKLDEKSLKRRPGRPPKRTNLRSQNTKLLEKENVEDLSVCDNDLSASVNDQGSLYHVSYSNSVSDTINKKEKSYTKCDRIESSVPFTLEKTIGDPLIHVPDLEPLSSNKRDRVNSVGEIHKLNTNILSCEEENIGTTNSSLGSKIKHSDEVITIDLHTTGEKVQVENNKKVDRCSSTPEANSEEPDNIVSNNKGKYLSDVIDRSNMTQQQIFLVNLLQKKQNLQTEHCNKSLVKSPVSSDIAKESALEMLDTNNVFNATDDLEKENNDIFDVVTDNVISGTDSSQQTPPVLKKYVSQKKPLSKLTINDKITDDSSDNNLHVETNILASTQGSKDEATEQIQIPAKEFYQVQKVETQQDMNLNNGESLKFWMEASLRQNSSRQKDIAYQTSTPINNKSINISDSSSLISNENISFIENENQLLLSETPIQTQTSAKRCRKRKSSSLSENYHSDIENNSANIDTNKVDSVDSPVEQISPIPKKKKEKTGFIDSKYSPIKQKTQDIVNVDTYNLKTYTPKRRLGRLSKLMSPGGEVSELCHEEKVNSQFIKNTCKEESQVTEEMDWHNKFGEPLLKRKRGRPPKRFSVNMPNVEVSQNISNKISTDEFMDTSPKRLPIQKNNNIVQNASDSKNDGSLNMIHLRNSVTNTSLVSSKEYDLPADKTQTEMILSSESPIKRRPGRPPKKVSLKRQKEKQLRKSSEKGKNIIDESVSISNLLDYVNDQKSTSLLNCTESVCENKSDSDSFFNNMDEQEDILDNKNNDELVNCKLQLNSTTDKDSLYFQNTSSKVINENDTLCVEKSIEKKICIEPPVKRRPGRPPKRLKRVENYNLSGTSNDESLNSTQLLDSITVSHGPVSLVKNLTATDCVGVSGVAIPNVIKVSSVISQKRKVGRSTARNKQPEELSQSIGDMELVANLDSATDQDSVSTLNYSDCRNKSHFGLKKDVELQNSNSAIDKISELASVTNVWKNREPVVKRKPGRPKKVSLESLSTNDKSVDELGFSNSSESDSMVFSVKKETIEPTTKRSRGRPRKIIRAAIIKTEGEMEEGNSYFSNESVVDLAAEEASNTTVIKRRRGRPPKKDMRKNISFQTSTPSFEESFDNQGSATHRRSRREKKASLSAFNSDYEVETHEVENCIDLTNDEWKPLIKRRKGQRGKRESHEICMQTTYDTFNNEGVKTNGIIEQHNSSLNQTIKSDEGSDAFSDWEDLSMKQKARIARRKSLSGRVDSLTKLMRPEDKVKCAVCGEIMFVKDYQRTHLLKHNFIAWLEGEEPLPVDDFDLMDIVLCRGKRALHGKFIFKCEICNQEKKSSKGFLSHKQFCGKTEKEKESMMTSCPHCGRVMIPASLPSHMYQSHRNIEDDLNQYEPIGQVRKAAAKCLGKMASYIEDDDPNSKNEDFQDVDGDEEFDEIEEISLLYTPIQKKRATKHLVNRWKQYADANKEIPCPVPSCKFKTLVYKEIVEHHKSCTSDGWQGYSCIKCSYICKIEDEIREHVKSCNPPIMVSQSDNSDDEEHEKNVVIPYLKVAEQSLGHLRYKCQFFKPSLTWMKQIYETKFSQESLFLDFALNIEDWVEMDAKTSQCYNPEKSNSMRISFENSQWESLHALEGKVLEGNQGLGYTGGPIWGLEWCPGEGDQYLAVSSHLTMESNYQAGSTFTGPGLVQIWSLEDINNSRSDILSTLQFSYGLCHNEKACWNMAWCPSGARTDTRIGLLALATTSGSIPIYAMPDPQCLTPLSTRFYKPDPVLKLELSSNERFQCSAISWSKVAPHSIIVAGFVNGIVAVWDLSTQSKLLRKKKIIYPFKVFQAHHSIITGVCLSPESETYLATASYDKSFKYWDLNDTTAPQSILKRGLFTSVDWLRHWMSAVTTYDNAYTMLQTSVSLSSVRSFISPAMQVVTNINSTAWNVSVNDWLNGAISSYDNGQVVLFLALKQASYQHLDKRKYSKVILQSLLHNFDEENESAHEKGSEKEDNTKSKKNKEKNKENGTSIRHIPSQSYGDAVQKYGLAIKTDLEVGRADKISQKSSESMNDIYPLSSINRVAWNTNRQSFLYIAMGYQSGFLVVSKLVFPNVDQASIDEVSK